jgi:hypothetical protein
MSIRSIPNTGPAQKCGTAYTPSKLDVQVLSPAGVFIRIAKTQDELATPLPFQGNQGLTFDSTAGVVELQWLGEVWIAGVAANASQPFIDVRMTPY